MTTEEQIKEHAFAIRKKFLNGELTYGEAKNELKGYKELYNRKAEELSQKYGTKPQKFRFGDFLKNNF